MTIWFSGPAILSLMAAATISNRATLARCASSRSPVRSSRRRRCHACAADFPHPRYFNFYGSTETNVAAYHELPADVELDGPPPIGHPCEHYEARVVGLDGERVPAGTPVSCRCAVWA